MKDSSQDHRAQARKRTQGNYVPSMTRVVPFLGPSTDRMSALKAFPPWLKCGTGKVRREQVLFLTHPEGIWYWSVLCVLSIGHSRMAEVGPRHLQVADPLPSCTFHSLTLPVSAQGELLTLHINGACGSAASATFLCKAPGRNPLIATLGLTHTEGSDEELIKCLNVKYLITAF